MNGKYIYRLKVKPIKFGNLCVFFFDLTDFGDEETGESITDYTNHSILFFAYAYQFGHLTSL